MVENEGTTNRPIHPLWLIPISLVAGLLACGPFAGAILHRCGFRRLGWGLGSTLMIAGCALLVLCALWGTHWYWVALTLSGVHLLCGTVLFLALRGPYREFITRQAHAAAWRGGYRSVLTGMIGGALLGALFGTALSIPYELLVDRLFSTLLPATFDDNIVLFRVIAGSIFMSFTGIVAGCMLGRFRPDITARRVFLYTIFLVWIQQSWMLSVDALIATPGFQANSEALSGLSSLIGPFIKLELLIGCWWSVFLLFFVISSQRLPGMFLRCSLTPAINLAAAITISVSFGYVGDLFLAVGKHFERTAQTSRALWFYELSLKKDPKEHVASYLQYRVALLNHKLGEREKARQGFSRVVAKYNRNQYLAGKANQFLDSLERKSEGKRVVLPGVETRTEYKGGYCVPNSLSLVMRYWGRDVSARTIGSRITALGSGTIVVDQRWFAEQEGMRHDFLPMAGIDDIKRLIDAGFPVLVYVPAHVFAVLGYDEALETLITYDVATADIWEEYIQKDFIKSWKKQATTLVLSYPPEKERMIPDDIRRRFENLSDNYLHYHLYYLDRPKDSVSIAHLSKAAEPEGVFFFPVTILYRAFPSLRASFDRTYDANLIAESIKEYFGNDFDEGLHMAGQLHLDERESGQDWALGSAVSYLIGNGRFDLVKALIERIDDQGRVSRRTLAEVGLMDLSIGDYSQGLDRLQRADDQSAAFYAGLARLKTGNTQGGIQELAKTVRKGAQLCSYGQSSSTAAAPRLQPVAPVLSFLDERRSLVLDEYGFPDVAVANETLSRMSDFGESRDALETSWESWIHHLPFDTSVGHALAMLYRSRLSKLEPEKDKTIYHRLTRKESLVQDRVNRYQTSLFIPNQNNRSVKDLAVTSP